jgi:hypothetical protein
MRARTLVAVASIAASSNVFAGGLSAAVLECDDQQRLATLSTIGGDIATALVRSLLGTAIDTVVNYLDDEKASTFEVILPVDSIDNLTSGQNCLFVSSAQLDGPAGLADKSRKPNVWSDPAQVPSTFLAKIRFAQSEAASKSDPAAPLRPVVLVWKYSAFLEPSCPLFRNCERRDVAMSLAFLSPASTVAGQTIASEPFGFVVTNSTAKEVEAAVPVIKGTGAALPWFLPGNAKGPTNIRFKLVETSQPNAFTKALAAAIEAEKTKIQDTVENKLKGISDQVAAQAAQKDVVAAAQALDDYKKAYDTAYATKLAYDATSDAAQKKVLKAQYEVQRASARLTETLGAAAFAVANLAWPSGGLGPLPDL